MYRVSTYFCLPLIRLCKAVCNEGFNFLKPNEREEAWEKSVRGLEENMVKQSIMFSNYDLCK